MKEKLAARLETLKSAANTHNALIDSRERPDGKTWDVRKGMRDAQSDEIAFLEGVLA